MALAVIAIAVLGSAGLWVFLPDGPTPAPDEHPPPREPTDLVQYRRIVQGGGFVVVSLPFSDQLALVAADGRRYALIPAGVESPVHAALDRGSLLIVGTGGSEIASIDMRDLVSPEEPEDDPPLADTVVVSEPASSFWQVLSVPEGVFALWDRSDERSFLSKVRGEMLREHEATPVSRDAYSAAYSRGAIWTDGLVAYRGRLRAIVTRTDLRTLESRRFSLPDVAGGIASDSDGHVFVTVASGSVLEFSPLGKRLSRIRGVGPDPWGLAIGNDGVGVVAAEGDDGGPGAIHVVDFRSHEVLRTYELGDACPLSRDVAILGKRAFVTCAAIPAVAVIDLTRKQLPRVLRFEVDSLRESSRGVVAIRT